MTGGKGERRNIFSGFYGKNFLRLDSFTNEIV